MPQRHFRAITRARFFPCPVCGTASAKSEEGGEESARERGRRKGRKERGRRSERGQGHGNKPDNLRICDMREESGEACREGNEREGPKAGAGGGGADPKGGRHSVVCFRLAAHVPVPIDVGGSQSGPPCWPRLLRLLLGATAPPPLPDSPSHMPHASPATEFRQGRGAPSKTRINARACIRLSMEQSRVQGQHMRNRSGVVDVGAHV